MSINLSGRALKRLRLPVVNYYSSAYQVMSAQAGDVNTRYLDVVLYDDRGDIDLSAYSKVYLQVQAYDGISPQMSEGWIDTERNRAVCRLTSSMLQYTGSKMPCNIWLVGTDADDEPMSLTSQTFYVMVYEGHGGADAEPSEDELTALQSAINDVVELEKTVGEAEATRQENFRSVYIKYSFDANGYNYTDSWQQGQQYMGVANTPEEPENAAGYSWILISGGSSGGSAVTVVGKNGYGFYRLDGEHTIDTTNVATENIQSRADREVQSGDMLITSEGLIFVLDEYDAGNDLQKVSYYTDISGGHYTPSVNDNGNGTMTVSFTASMEGMPDINPVTVTIPKGKDGGHYSPSIHTITENSFKISFTPSNSDMPVVEDVTITLPTVEDGVGIESIVQTTASNEDGGENVITITLTDGNKSTFKIKNGSKGSTGKTAFQYAKDAGYTGSEAEFSSKLANNEIYFGDDEVMPDDCNLQIFSDGNDVSEEYAPVNHNHDGVYIKQTELDDAVNTALATAKENGDFNGKDGETPYIGSNGNWWVGVTDTGVSAGNQGGSIGSVVLTDDGDGNFTLEVI